MAIAGHGCEDAADTAGAPALAAGTSRAAAGTCPRTHHAERLTTSQGKMMSCQVCGGHLPAEATSCPTCGAAVTSSAGGAPAPGAGPAGPGAAGGGPPPGAHPSGLPSEVRNWAMAAHLSSFLGAFVAIAALGPLVVWLVRKDVDGFSERHAREALNFNLTLLLLLVAGIVLSIVTFGIGLVVVVPLGLAIGVGWIVVTILAAVRASEGSEYRYPLTIRFIS